MIRRIIVELAYTNKSFSFKFTHEEFVQLPHYWFEVVSAQVFCRLFVDYQPGSPKTTPERVAQTVARKFVKEKGGTLLHYRIVNDDNLTMS